MSICRYVIPALLLGEVCLFALGAAADPKFVTYSEHSAIEDKVRAIIQENKPKIFLEKNFSEKTKGAQDLLRDLNNFKKKSAPYPMYGLVQREVVDRYLVALQPIFEIKSSDDLGEECKNYESDMNFRKVNAEDASFYEDNLANEFMRNFCNSSF